MARSAYRRESGSRPQPDVGGDLPAQPPMAVGLRRGLERPKHVRLIEVCILISKACRSPKVWSSIKLTRPKSSNREFCNGLPVSSSFWLWPSAPFSVLAIMFEACKRCADDELRQ